MEIYVLSYEGNTFGAYKTLEGAKEAEGFLATANSMNCQGRWQFKAQRKWRALWEDRNGNDFETIIKLVTLKD